MQSLKKVNRVQPLIRLKQRMVDEEAVQLNDIRTEKLGVVASMKESQRRYLDGVERLNQIRSSGLRENLETIEQSLDFVKEEWQRLFLKVQEIERRERAQFMRLLGAERDLKSVEKLKEKYIEEQHKEQNAREQKMLDEMALRKFHSRT